MPRVRVGKRGVIVIPKEVREKLGIKEGMLLELSVEKDRLVIKTVIFGVSLENAVRG